MRKIKTIFTSPARNAESGNVLFLILIAVALFAALSYVVTNSTRSGAGSISDEKARLLASQILNYNVAVATTLQKLVLGGCSLEQISFDRAPFDNSIQQYDNPAAPADFHCHIFHANGGALPYQIPPAEAQDIPAGQEFEMREYYYNISNQVLGVGTDNLGNFNVDSKDFMIMMPFASKKVCQALNRGIRREHEEPPEAKNTVNVVGFWGGDLEAVGSADIEDDDGYLHGQQTACMHVTSLYAPPNATPGYYFYSVMMAR